MVEFSGLVKINFFKKEKFTGSCGGMCFKVESKDENSVLLATIWPGPYSSDHTPDEKKQYAEFAFSPEGLEEIQEWLEEQYQAQSGLWKPVRIG